MKKFMLMTLASLFATMAAHASIVETKFKVTSRFYDELGNTKKLVNTRAFIRYNPEATIFSSSAKDDCLVSSGKSDILSLYTEPDRASCISSKTFVITSRDIVLDMFYRPAIFSLFSDYISEVYDIEKDNGKIKGRTASEVGLIGSLRSIIKNTLANAAEAQVISTVDRTVFELKGDGRAKFIIELEPVKTKLLNN
jgi:hypothetical protein